MVFKISEEERKILNLVSESAEDLGLPAYVVGGYVRDKLLARPCKDIDIVCIGDCISLAEQLTYKLHPIPRITVYRRFGTAMIKHKDFEIEFVSARKESYTFNSRKPYVEEGTLEDDQNRRDFTINALAVSLNKEDFGELLDPFDGLKHLEEKLIITPMEAGKTFSDDPLRMMRAIRFSTQLEFTIHPSTLKAISTYKKRIEIISKERIASELNKIILASRPSVGFKLLFDTGLLHLIFPEMTDLHGVEIKKGIGHKDNFYHTLEVLDNIALETDNLWLRWAAILHDIAKPATKRFDPQLGWTFHGHEALGAVMAAKIFKKLRLPLDDKLKYVQKLVRMHLRPISLTQEDITDSAVRRLIFDAGEDIDDLMTLCKADITSKNQSKVDRYKSNYDLLKEKIAEVERTDELRNWQPPISGEIIMNTFDIRPSKEVGILKDYIRESILDGVIANDFNAAFELMLEKGKEMGLKTHTTM